MKRCRAWGVVVEPGYAPAEPIRFARAPRAFDLAGLEVVHDGSAGFMPLALGRTLPPEPSFAVPC
ncbi:MAG TPA: hypothetical protein VF881_04560 [Polyangiaceae bacterium]